jgi:hypothetical protein
MAYLMIILCLFVGDSGQDRVELSSLIRRRVLGRETEAVLCRGVGSIFGKFQLHITKMKRDSDKARSMRVLVHAA